MHKRYSGSTEYYGYLVVDEIVLQIALLLAFYFRHHTFAYSMPIYRNFALVLILIDVFVVLVFNTMDDVNTRGYYVEAVKTLNHCFYVFAISIIYMFAMQYGEEYSRITLFLMFVLHSLIGYVTRILCKSAVKKKRRDDPARANMLVVTTEDNVAEILETLSADESADYRIAGVVLADRSAVAADRPDERSLVNDVCDEICGYPIACRIEDASDYVCREWVDSVYIDAPLSDARVSRFMDDCGLMGVPTHYHFITGMWQVSGRSNITDFEEVVRLDTEYIANWTPGLDLRILAKTVGVVLSGKGAE